MSRALVLGKVWWGPDQHKPHRVALNKLFQALPRAIVLKEIKAQGRLL